MAAAWAYPWWAYIDGGEIIAGLPNVDTSSFLDTWIKFGLANASWLVFPPVLLAWGAGRLLRGDQPPVEQRQPFRQDQGIVVYTLLGLHFTDSTDTT